MSPADFESFRTKEQEWYEGLELRSQVTLISRFYSQRQPRLVCHVNVPQQLHIRRRCQRQRRWCVQEASCFNLYVRLQLQHQPGKVSCIHLNRLDCWLDSVQSSVDHKPRKLLLAKFKERPCTASCPGLGAAILTRYPFESFSELPNGLPKRLSEIELLTMFWKLGSGWSTFHRTSKQRQGQYHSDRKGLQSPDFLRVTDMARARSSRQNEWRFFRRRWHCLVDLHVVALHIASCSSVIFSLLTYYFSCC